MINAFLRRWRKTVDPEEFKFVVQLSMEAALGERLRTIKRPEDFVRLFFDEVTGEPKAEILDDKPMNRSLVAIKQFCEGDSRKFRAMVFRTHALMKIIHLVESGDSEGFEKLVLWDEEDVSIHEKVFEVAAFLPINKRTLEFSLKDFKRELLAIPDTET